MPLVPTLTLLFTSFVAMAAPASGRAAEARNSYAKALGTALRGDVAPAISALRGIDPVLLDARMQATRSCMLERFAAGADGSLSGASPPFVARLLGIYQSYWRASLLAPTQASQAEAQLRANLARLLGAEGDMEALEAALADRLKQDGYYVLLGRTPPLREFMLWRQSIEQVWDIALPGASQRVTVQLLDDFESLGWAAFATCDRRHSGGWVRPDGIYAVRKAYPDLEAEAFQISLLAHEAQHFADKMRFGEALPAWRLEYRAKLVELALARTSRANLLAVFVSNMSDDQNLPHAHANKRVLDGLAQALMRSVADLAAADPVLLGETAARLLSEDTARASQE